MQLFKKGLGFYFFSGAIILYVYYIHNLLYSHAISYVLPHFIATLVFGFYIFSGYLFLKNPEAGSSRTLFTLMLLLQSVQMEVNGFVFKNFYFPLFNVKLDLRLISNSMIDHSIFSFKVGNGYFPNNDNIIVSVNLLLVILMIIVNIPNGKRSCDLKNDYWILHYVFSSRYWRYHRFLRFALFLTVHAVFSTTHSIAEIHPDRFVLKRYKNHST